MLNLIIFDWDGVLALGTLEGQMACYQKAVEDRGLDISKKEVRARVMEQWGKRPTEIAGMLAAEDPYKAEATYKTYEALLRTDLFTKHITCVPGGKEMLGRLKEHFKLALVTNTNPETLREKVLPDCGIPTDLFDRIFSLYDIPKPEFEKPHPYMLQRIREDLQVEPQDAIFVGDAEADVRMARRAGMEPVVVLTGRLDRAEAESLNVDRILDNVADLESLPVIRVS